MATPARHRVARVLALLVGLVYLTLGILGFVLADPTHVGNEPSNAVWIFSTSILLNLTHLTVGVLGIAAVTSVTRTQLFGWFSLVALTGLTVYGLFASATNSPGDGINVNWADTVLHAITALLGLVIGLLAERRARRPAETT
ncbi:protein of unknown function [Amycolatopsis arida]|uniref:DUF4383 domain-containing protein n=1 Tax=Amycolatopsis arida TaxID=587909 RepID=A0A1I5XG85_9PSEU|nr:DUF4383 domain-containing protein [Amycolatopsis arida]TDX97473.1 uncharacterized protein DUF4383 [Amycolatopsis arida]SFQ30979.1 protein of unknown function [Amycolatopsis arida]